MKTYQANPDSQSSEELISQLIPDTSNINHIEVIENATDTLAQKGSAMVSRPQKVDTYGSLPMAVSMYLSN